MVDSSKKYLIHSAHDIVFIESLLNNSKVLNEVLSRGVAICGVNPDVQNTKFKVIAAGIAQRFYFASKCQSVQLLLVSLLRA